MVCLVSTAFIPEVSISPSFFLPRLHRGDVHGEGLVHLRSYRQRAMENHRAPAVCAVLVVTNLLPINFVGMIIVVRSVVSLVLFLLGLPQMHRRLVHSLGEAGHQLFSILLLGYIATMALAAQIQLIELVSKDIFTYTILLDSTLHTYAMDHPTVLAILFSLNGWGN